MTKKLLYRALAFIAVGIGFFIAVFLTSDKTMAVRYSGLGGGFIGPGIALLWQYFYWSKPEHAEEYAKRTRAARIDSRDERKNMIRGKAAILMLWLTMLLLITLIFVLSLSGAPQSTLLLVSGLMVFEIVGGVFAVRYYNGKM
jgi:hypothetical protein